MSRKMIDYKVEEGKITSIDGYKVGGGELYTHLITLSGIRETAMFFLTTKSAEPFTIETLNNYFAQFSNTDKIYIPARCYDSDYKRYGFVVLHGYMDTQHKQHAWRALYYRNDSSRGTSINEEKEGLELNTVSDVVIPA